VLERAPCNEQRRHPLELQQTRGAVPPGREIVMVRIGVLLIFVVGVALRTAAGGSQPVAAPPNVVLIMTDDAGYGDFGAYGATDVRTPNIDRIAREGVKLTDFYANGATCTPTRAGLISGRWQQRFTLERPLGAQGQKDWERGLAATGSSLPQLLKNNGYATALIGKWHLGWTRAFSPIAHGFQYFFGFKSGFIDYYQHVAGSDSPLKSDLFENDEPIEVDGYMTELIAQRAIRFIEQNAGRPFFVDVAFNAPHWPYQPPNRPSIARDNARHLGPFDDATGTRADYVAMVEALDEGVGRILSALDRLGLSGNTMVIFTNDNGGEWLAHGGPLFHHKSSVWEGGIRVPAIIKWPGRIPAATVSEQVAITMDLTATILAATRTPVPAAAQLDGINLLPVLEQRGAPASERTLFWRTAGQRAARSGDWKLVVDGGRPLLFNLRADIGERKNVIAERPEIAKRLRDLLVKWETEVDAGQAR
jgi:arylsulfatase A-like enzyme